MEMKKEVKKVFRFLKKYAWQSVVAVLFVLSVFLNAYLLSPSHKNISYSNNIVKNFVPHHTHALHNNEGEKENHFAQHYESHVSCINGVCKRLDDERKMSKEEVQELRDEIEAQHKKMMQEFARMDAFFQRQHELFNEFWNF